MMMISANDGERFLRDDPRCNPFQQPKLHKNRYSRISSPTLSPLKSPPN